MTIRLVDTHRPSLSGSLEFIFKDRHGRVIGKQKDHNIVKIFSKEILSHRAVSATIWDPDTSAWVSSGIDTANEFALRYVLFGASFDDDGAPLDNVDSRYYTRDAVTGVYVPIALGVGAEYDGGLINAIPIAEPERGLKKIERVYFESTYQPAGTPFLQDDVRAVNNVLVLETTLRADEYNGFGSSNSSYFTITEVALAAGKELGVVDACELKPEALFLEGRSGVALSATATGTSTITLAASEAAYVNLIKEGDQVKILASGSAVDSTSTLNQINPNYLVISKVTGGSDIVLDRVPVDSDNVPLTGSIGVFRNSLRLFSHRCLSNPFRKGAETEVTLRWSIIMN